MPISTANEPSSAPRWRPRPKPKPADLAPLPPDPRFLQPHELDPVMHAALAPLDRLAAAMEATWGVDRLISLVTPQTAARFASARRKLDLAIRGKSVDDASAKAAVLMRGWTALDAEARALGHNPDAIDVWCIRHPVSEKAYAITRHAQDVGAARRLYPDHTAIALADLIASHMVTFRAQQLSAEPLPDDDVPF
jgi:hypothetical protein